MAGSNTCESSSEERDPCSSRDGARADPPYVTLEFEKFIATKRTIVPINISDALTRNNKEALTRQPWNIIKSRNLVWIDETDDAFAKKNPSPPVADGIEPVRTIR
jgi:hypothetical protein